MVYEREQKVVGWQRQPLAGEVESACIFSIDCGKTYDGDLTSVITGLDHLDGELVNILADGQGQGKRGGKWDSTLTLSRKT